MSRVAVLVTSTYKRLGQCSRRETALLFTVLVIVLVYLLGNRLVLASWDTWQKERTRHQASQVSLAKLNHLLEHRDIILHRARTLMEDYLQSQGAEPSSLLLQRIDKMKSREVQLQSLYPLGRGRGDGVARFRVELLGPPKDLARLLYDLGEGAPPIMMSNIDLVAMRGGSGSLRALVTLELRDAEYPAEWVSTLEEARSGEKEGPSGERGRPRPEERSVAPKPLPYQHLAREGVFQLSRGGEKRLSTPSPTIQSLVDNLSFLGVIWEETPMVILGDKESGETYYLRAGEFIGDLEILEIDRTYVILRYEDEEARLD